MGESEFTGKRIEVKQGAWTLSTWFESPITSDGVDFFFHAPAFGDASSGFIFIENHTVDFVNFELRRLGLNPVGLP